MIIRGVFRTAFAVSVLLASTSAMAGFVKEEYAENESAELEPTLPADLSGFTSQGPTTGGGAYVVQGFEGLSQYTVGAFGRGFIPPDTMGAVGTTQYVSFVNGGVGIYSKATGAAVSIQSDVAFWAAAGQTGVNGDSRVMFNKTANRWIALAFGSSVSDIQIAVSDTDNAAGTWQSTRFTGFAGGTADYPTLALDGNAVYIGTNNFNASGNFRGTTLNVIPLASLFNAGAPTTAGRAVLNTPYNPTTGGDDGGFAIQGVNKTTAGPGHVIAASLFLNDTIRYDVNFTGPNPTSVTPIQYLGTQDYDGNGPGRQPNAVPDVDVNTTDGITSNNRVIDTLDSRIGASVYEVDGRIYFVYTATDVGDDFTHVRYGVVDAATNAILDEGSIGDGVHDFYQGSLAVNSFGQVVIGYNRSGSEAGTGNITFAAQVFSTGVDGQLTARGIEQILKVSIVDDYHNGSLFGQVAAGRQRWGDYSAVSLDPTDERSFWAIGEYAREYNNAAGGHPGGTGGSRWSTWISHLNVGTTVPEPATWALMIGGFGMAGTSLRRQRRRGYATA